MNELMNEWVNYLINHCKLINEQMNQSVEYVDILRDKLINKMNA